MTSTTGSVDKLGMGSGRLTICILCLSVAVNVVLTYQLSQVRSEMLESAPVSIGERVKTIALVARDGTRSTYEFEGAGLPTLVYWFRPSCIWCEANLPNVEALARQAGEKYRFLAVSDSSPAELSRYASSHQLGFPVYTMLPVSVAQSPFQATPASLLVSARGLTAKYWSGAYVPTTLVDVEETLGINLPGLSAQVQRGTVQ